MPYHLTFVCSRCGERNMSPAIADLDLVEATTRLLIAVVSAPQEAADVAGCSRCNLSAVDQSPDQVAGRERAIYHGPVTA